MGQGVKRTQRNFSLAIQPAQVDLIEKGELTYKQALARDGLKNRLVIRPKNWGTHK
ncbi:hypothetical protein QMX34_004644 [Aeromonas hydrophila]|nr:hypothetical protein [Aeromonas hydrophila]